MSTLAIDGYRRLRDRVLELGRSLDETQAGVVAPCCPAWTVTDVFSHMAGVAADVLDGNTEGAATEAWADAQVDARRGRSLAEVCDELEVKGAELDGILAAAFDAFPPQFFIDAWTHEWDIRQAIDAPAEPDLTLCDHVMPFLISHHGAAIDEAGLPALLITFGDGAERTAGSARLEGSLRITRFEYARARMGRRSARQLGGLGWEVDDIAANVRALVAWSVNDVDIIDPVR